MPREIVTTDGSSFRFRDYDLPPPGARDVRVKTIFAAPKHGTESHSMLRFGGRYTTGTVRIDGALLFGLTTEDPGFGVTGGLTYVFNAFTLP